MATVLAQTATATGVAYRPWVNRVYPDTITATGTAYDCACTVSSVTAQTADATGVAYDARANRADTETAYATGEAFNASVSHPVTPAEGSGTGTAYNCTCRITTKPITAFAWGTATWLRQPWQSRVSALLFESDNLTPVGPVTDFVTCEWQDVLNDAGFGTLTVQADDAIVPDLLHDRIVRCLIDGVPVFAWVIKKRTSVLVAAGEEADEQVTVEGIGLLAWLLSRWIVYPGPATYQDAAYALSIPPLADHRLFTAASPDWWWTGGDNDQPATELWRQGDPGSYWTLPDGTSPAPAAWPDPDAQWIWAGGSYEGAPEGRCWFMQWWTNTVERNVVIYATGDNLWSLYMNGVPILGDDVNPLCWQETRTVTLRCPPGAYNFAAVVENTGGAGANPGGFLCAIYEMLGDGTLGDLIVRSDSGWTAWAYPPEDQFGWSPAAIVDELIYQARYEDGRGPTTPGVTINPWTPDFDQDANGAPWPLLSSFATPVGSTVWETLVLLMAAGYIDAWMDPVGLPVYSSPFVLYLWNGGTRGQDTMVMLTKGTNLTALTWEE